MNTKIANAKVFKYGGAPDGIGIKIPLVFVQDNQIEAQDEFQIYRTAIDGRDALILLPAKSNGKSSTEINQTEQAESKQ